MERGLLIVFEGLDGCGKSTQLQLLYEGLDAQGIDCLRTKEPTDGPWGRRIREMARGHHPIAPEEELEWFMEDRREHVLETIEPALARGCVVLSDRYWLSSVAYQGARGLDAEAIQRANEAEFPAPDLALLFELPPAEGLARVRARGGVLEPVFEELDFLQRVAAVFAGIERPWLVRVDARRAPREIAAEVSVHVRKLGLPVAS